MKLLDLILGPRCADCGTRIKGKKISLPDKQVLCRPCKGTRDAAREAAEQERRNAETLSQLAAEQERRNAETLSQLKARLAKYLEEIDRELAKTAPEANDSLRYKFLRATTAEMRHSFRIQTDRDVAGSLWELLLTGRIEEEGSDLFLLTTIIERHVEKRTADVESLMAIKPGDMGRNFIALFTATSLMSILVRNDPTGQRMKTLDAVFGHVGWDLKQAAPYSRKADLYQEIAAIPSETFDPLFEVPGPEATEQSSEQRQKQDVALDRYLYYFAHQPLFLYIFEVVANIETANFMFAEDLLANAVRFPSERATAPVNMSDWIRKARLAVGNVSIQRAREEAEKQKRSVEQVHKECEQQAAAEVASEMSNAISQKLIQSLLVFAQQVL